jgi:L-ribulokinase
MAKKKTYALGLDFGTESVRALLVNVATGAEVANVVVRYPHGVITDNLPKSSAKLGADWALQHPGDYVNGMTRATKDAMKLAKAIGDQVCGIGISFTACTMLPTTADGKPLSALPKFAKKPNAWCKLWKHHAAQPQADKINDIARKRKAKWLDKYGGIVSSEWFFPKALQALEEEPDVFRAADVYIEAGEWIVWQLTGQKARSTCHGGYKQCWHKREGYPSAAFWKAVNPKFIPILDKIAGPRVAPGECAGRLTAPMAKRMGLVPGIAVSSSIIDAHAGVPGAGCTGTDVLVMVMGTSTCHMIMAEKEMLAAGTSGVVEDGILPGLFGYEAGQVAVGDIFAWYVDHAVPAYIEVAAAKRKKTVHEYLTQQADKLAPGESGILALDWWNGNRTPFVDANLSGLIVGLTLHSKPHEIYRALIEATAFGTLQVIDTFAKAGVKTRSLLACGGIAQKNPMLMQIYADVTNRPIAVAASTQASSLGAAILGATAAGESAGGFDSARAAVENMCAKPTKTYRPIAKNHAVYAKLYAEYLKLSSSFGQYRLSTMKTLRELSSM